MLKRRMEKRKEHARGATREGPRPRGPTRVVLRIIIIIGRTILAIKPKPERWIGSAEVAIRTKYKTSKPNQDRTSSQLFSITIQGERTQGTEDDCHRYNRPLIDQVLDEIKTCQ